VGPCTACSLKRQRALLSSLNGKIPIVPYNPEWPLMYARLERHCVDLPVLKAAMRCPMFKKVAFTYYPVTDVVRARKLEEGESR
jgi:hypothetical protein